MSEAGLLAAARTFSDQQIRPRAAEFEQSGVPATLIREMAAAGFLAAPLPVAYGGLGVSARTYGELTEAIGKGCNSVRALLTVHSSLVGETIARLGSEAQKQYWLPKLASGEVIGCFALSEPAAGSDAAAISTRYCAVAGGYLLSGRKKWITYGAVADLLLVLAKDEDSDAISAFLLDHRQGGVRTEPMQGLLASRGAHLADIWLEQAFVPASDLLGQAGMGFSMVANTALFYGRYSIAWGGLGIVAAALEEMVTYARSRHQFGGKLAQHQLVKAMIADATTSLHCGRALCEKIADLRARQDDAAVPETNIAKYFTSKAAVEVSNNAVQLFGGNGLWQAYGVERLFREAKVLEIIEGSSQIQQLLIAGQALRDYYRPALKALYPTTGASTSQTSQRAEIT